MIKNFSYSVYLLFISVTILSCRKDRILTGNINAVPATQFKVIGYLPSWQGNVADVQIQKLTHITYSFLIPTFAGGYYPLDGPGRLDSMVSIAHNHHVKAIISVGGADSSFAFSGIVSTQALRTIFVNNMISFTSQHNLDGVDIDWEYPAVGVEADNFFLLMQQLSTALHLKGRLLSMAVIGAGGSYVEPELFAVTDYFEIMAYDENHFQHSTFQLSQDCLAYWLDKGMPVAKAMLGVPFYGHNSLVSADDQNATVEYSTLLSYGANTSLDVFDGIGYNGLITIRSKASYAVSKAGGLAIWELSGDVSGTNSLLTAIDETVVTGGHINNQAPFGKIISLRASNGGYISSQSGLKAMTCTSQVIGASEKFTVTDAGYGRVSFMNSGFYVSSDRGLNPISCSSPNYSGYESFDWIPLSNGQVSIRSSTGEFISGESGLSSMTCNRVEAGTTEYFNMTL